MVGPCCPIANGGQEKTVELLPMQNDMSLDIAAILGAAVKFTAFASPRVDVCGYSASPSSDRIYFALFFILFAVHCLEHIAAVISSIHAACLSF
jgi:hypothetical protein